MTRPGRSDGSAGTEETGLPSWLFPLGFWVAVAGLAVALLLPAMFPTLPDLAHLAVYWMMLVPVLAALWVAVASARRDRRLAAAALVALVGLVVVYVVKGLIG